MKHFIPDRQTALARSARNNREVERMHPDASRIKKVDGGWRVFQTEEEYQIWRHKLGMELQMKTWEF